MKKDKWEWQGKTRKQVQFSEMVAGGSMLVMIIVILLTWIWRIIS
jgi:hypothetical protein